MDMQKIQTIREWLQTGSVNFFGPPFSGKDTQAKRIADAIGGLVVSGGDILRKAQDNQELQRIMAAGEVIPPELFLSIIPPFFAHQDIADKPLLLSSVGRLPEEIPVVVEAAFKSGHEIKAAVLLVLTTDDVWEHFEIAQKLGDRGQRADDTPDALKKRLAEFEKTQPVIAYYKNNGLLLEVDGSGTVDEVTRAIVDALYTRAVSA